MLQEFTLSEGKAIINFSLKYCDSRQKILNSYGFRRVIETFILRLKKDSVIHYNYYINYFKTDEEFTKSLIEFFKLLTVCDIAEVLEVNNKYVIFTDDKDLFIELVELLYSFWRRLGRFAIVQNSSTGDGLQNVRFSHATELFNELVLSIYRRIEETVMGYQHRVYRQLSAGINAGLRLSNIQWNCPVDYSGLKDIPFITSVIFYPPLITYSKNNTRDGLFQEYTTNPLNNVVLNQDEWFLFPVKVGSMLAFVYFHKDYMTQGFGLANLFELAKENEYVGKKPDMIYLFGYKDGYEEKRTFYYKDKVNDILIGYANHSEEVDYFGYMKKMLLTLHNLKQMEYNHLPIHGAMVNILLNNGTEANIVIMGDSGAGKSECLEAFRTLNEEYIRHMRIIFDDMGILKIEEDGSIKGYGTEIGAFVRVDDLDPSYVFQQIERGIFMNPDKVNARVTIPAATYDTIMKGYKVDYFLYANNYEDSKDRIAFFSDLNKAITVFEDGARRAKGTTSEKGLVKSFFANPFGPVQEKDKAKELINIYFHEMEKQGVKIGEIYTKLAIPGNETTGPKAAAEEMFKIINN